MTRLKRGDRLRGRTVLLAAGLPERKVFEETFAKPSPWDIDQAVTALARAVFAEGGRLVVEGDPSLTLLLAMIAGEYQTQRFAEGSGPLDADPTPPVRVYRDGGRSEREREDEAVLSQFNIVSFAGEANDDKFGQADFGPIKGEDPAALVCIGGGPRTIDLASSFADAAPYRPIFAIATSGGAAARLAVDPAFAVEALDLEIAETVWSRARARLEVMEFEYDRRRFELEQKIVPYPIIMQLIVERIIRGEGWMKA